MCKLHVCALMESPVVSKSPVGVVGEWRGGDKRQVLSTTKPVGVCITVLPFTLRVPH